VYGWLTTGQRPRRFRGVPGDPGLGAIRPKPACHTGVCFSQQVATPPHISGVSRFDPCKANLP
jgi:hypothetical protein